MNIRELDMNTIKTVTKENIRKEIHRLEGRIDFLSSFDGIPEDVREQEIAHAFDVLHCLDMKLFTYHAKGEI